MGYCSNVLLNTLCRRSISFSTVDSANHLLFEYVVRLKNSKTHVCHVFQCKTSEQVQPKSMLLGHVLRFDSLLQSFDMTFTCAQAFDAKYKQWQADKAKQQPKPATLTGDDVECASSACSRLITSFTVSSPSIVSPPPAPSGDHSAPPTDLKVVVPQQQQHQHHAQPNTSPKVHSPLQAEADAGPVSPLNPFTEVCVKHGIDFFNTGHAGIHRGRRGRR